MYHFGIEKHSVQRNLRVFILLYLFRTENWRKRRFCTAQTHIPRHGTHFYNPGPEETTFWDVQSENYGFCRRKTKNPGLELLSPPGFGFRVLSFT